MKRLLIFLTAGLIASTILPGCSPAPSQPVAGPGDDFPNSTTALARAFSTALNANSDWQHFNNLPDTLPDTLVHHIPNADSLLVSPADSTNALPPVVLAKALADIDTTFWNYTDSSSGFVLKLRQKEDFNSWSSESSLVYYNPLIFDTIIGNENRLRVSGRVNYKPKDYSIYQFIDTDTNKFLDSATFTYATEYPGYTSFFVTTGTSGNDNNFTDFSKLKIASLALFDIGGYDTRRLLYLSDADHDGNIYTTGKATNDVYLRTFSLQRIPGELTNDQRMIARIVSSDSTQIDVAKYWSYSTFSDGHNQMFSVTGPSADSLVWGGDTALVNYSLYATPSYDTIQSLFKVALAPDIYNWQNHHMTSYQTTLSAPVDTISLFTFDFNASPSLTITDSLASINGTFSATVVWMNGEEATVTGVVNHGTIDGTYLDNGGKARRLTWNSLDGLKFGQ